MSDESEVDYDSITNWRERKRKITNLRYCQKRQTKQRSRFDFLSDTDSDEFDDRKFSSMDQSISLAFDKPVSSSEPDVNLDKRQIDGRTISEEDIDNISDLCEGIVLSSESTFDSDNHSNSESSLWDDLRKTAIETNLTDQQTNRILQDLKRHGVGPLPIDARTLRQTHEVRPEEIKTVSGMEYYCFGYRNQILKTLSRYPDEMLNKTDILMIKDNVDGLPLYKSSCVTVWPLLAAIDNLKPVIVFPVVITVGISKPSDLQFLSEAVAEMNDLTKNGIMYHGRTIRIQFTAHICDTPARHMVKDIVSFNAYYGCDYCTTKGVHDGKRMTWPSTHFTERTDESFRSRSQPQHHKNMSPSIIESFPCDMINDFPYDFMHISSGVTLKLLTWITSGPRRVESSGVICRMSASNVRLLNERLLAIRTCIPNCFARRPGGVKDLPRFKATQFRQILLYTSKILLHDLMPTDEHFEHILELSFGCALLTDSTTAVPFNDIANNLLKSFVEKAPRLYGNSFMVYNIHALLHLAKTASVHGCLDVVSAYKFENKLGDMKRSVRSALHPIVSLVKSTLMEMEMNKNTKIHPPENKIYVKYPNNVYIDVENHKCYLANEVVPEGIKVQLFLNTRPFLTKPIDSSIIGCYRANNSNYIYRTIDKDKLLSFRRGMKVDLQQIKGSNEYGTSIFMAMLHSSHESKYC